MPVCLLGAPDLLILSLSKDEGGKSVSALLTRPLAQARGIRRSKRSTGPFRSPFGEPLLILSLSKDEERGTHPKLPHPELVEGRGLLEPNLLILSLSKDEAGRDGGLASPQAVGATVGPDLGGGGNEMDGNRPLCELRAIRSLKPYVDSGSTVVVRDLRRSKRL